MFICPFCSVEYTAEAPCFCHAAVAEAPESRPATGAPGVPEAALAAILTLQVPARTRRAARA